MSCNIQIQSRLQQQQQHTTTTTPTPTPITKYQQHFLPPKSLTFFKHNNPSNTTTTLTDDDIHNDDDTHHDTNSGDNGCDKFISINNRTTDHDNIAAMMMSYGELGTLLDFISILAQDANGGCIFTHTEREDIVCYFTLQVFVYVF